MTEARMQETPEYGPGTFCWVELGTTDGEAAKKFYTELFGWSFNDSPIGPGMVYTMLKLDGKDVGALYKMPSEMTDHGVPPHWMSYVSVSSADESAGKAKELGAALMKEPFDVMDVGRMAVVQDPTGAMFALWQAGTHNGAGVVNVPNSFCWNELATPDTTKAGDFLHGPFRLGQKRSANGTDDVHLVYEWRSSGGRNVYANAGNGRDSTELARVLCRGRYRRQASEGQRPGSEDHCAGNGHSRHGTICGRAGSAGCSVWGH